MSKNRKPHVCWLCGRTCSDEHSSGRDGDRLCRDCVQVARENSPVPPGGRDGSGSVPTQRWGLARQLADWDIPF